MRRLAGSRGRVAALTSGLAACALVMLGAPAVADDTTSIDHVQPTQGGKVAILLSVPGVEPIDLTSAKVRIDGKPVAATVENAADADVRRTAVLAIDTSDSMAGAKFRQAKAAALSYLTIVPDNVYVGVVTFDKKVRVVQAPSQDRGSAQAAINNLTLAHDTALNQGVVKAIDTVGDKGGRTVVVLSDGGDTTRFPLADVLSQVKASGAKVDAVALQQSGRGLTSLARIAEAGHGKVLNADNPTVLTQAFQDEARTLARQVLVTADVPAAKSVDGDVEVTITAGGKSYSDGAFASVRLPAATKVDKLGNAIPLPAPGPHFAISNSLMLGGVSAIGVGLVGIILAFAFKRGSATSASSVEGQIATYGVAAAAARRGPKAAQVAAPSIANAAKQRAAAILASNRGLEVKIAARLEGAGMALKAAEWLLLHGIIALGTALILLLLTGGNIFFLVFGLVIGVVLPWLYLGLKGGRRIKAFQSALPDTLQLMAGSLSAGLSLGQSLDTIVREGTEPICGEFKRVTVESRLGVGIEDAMEGVARRMESRDFEWVVMAIRIQREVGGNLSELLLTVADTLREREYIRRHVRALSAEGRLSCYVLGGLPPAFLAYLSLSKWDYVAPLFTTPVGFVLTGAMAALLAVGVFWMSKVSKVAL